MSVTSEQGCRGGKISKTDITVILIIFASALLTIFHLIINNHKDKQLIINYNNQIFTTEPLNQSKTIPLDSLATIIIDNGKAKISASTCKNQDCVKQGWSDTQPIICVPNKILLQFTHTSQTTKEDIFITR